MHCECCLMLTICVRTMYKASTHSDADSPNASLRCLSQCSDAACGVIHVFVFITDCSINISAVKRLLINLTAERPDLLKSSSQSDRWVKADKTAVKVKWVSLRFIHLSWASVFIMRTPSSAFTRTEENESGLPKQKLRGKNGL